MGGCCALILFIRQRASMRLWCPVMVSIIVGQVFLNGYYTCTQFLGWVVRKLFVLLRVLAIFGSNQLRFFLGWAPLAQAIDPLLVGYGTGGRNLHLF